MIAYLSGKVLRSSQGAVVVLAGNVGYLVNINNRIITTEGMEISLWIETIVREESIQLVGFENCDEQEWFRLLIAIPGVGMKSALNILSAFTVDEIYEIIVSDRAPSLQTAGGIGAKMAARIVIELRPKVQKWVPGTPSNNAVFIAVEALVSLGYDRADASKSIKDILIGTESADELVKKALQSIGAAKFIGAKNA